MRHASAVFVMPCLLACAPPAPTNPVDLPYSACGAMADLRSSLTGGPETSPESNARMRRLGVRCVGESENAVRARY